MSKGRVLEPDAVRILRLIDGRVTKLLRNYTATGVAESARISAVSSSMSAPVSTSTETAEVNFESDGDGTNNTNVTRTNATTWVLASTPLSGSLKVYVNGMRQRSGAGNDYTLSTATITFLYSIASGDDVMGDYKVEVSGA